MRVCLCIVICALLFLACAAGSNRPDDDDMLAGPPEVTRANEVTAENAVDVLDSYTVDFTVPNPLFGETMINPRRFDPSHQSVLECSAVLLDDVSTRADILVKCAEDSLDAAGCRRFAEKYREEHVRDGMFRIRIAMESGFSPKSMDPDFWALYIETAEGVMVEPNDIVTGPVASSSDSVYSNYHRQSRARNLFFREIELYFDRTTFFGVDLFGKENPWIVFVMSREKKIVARMAWMHKGGEIDSP